jgi:hypothetical protein
LFKIIPGAVFFRRVNLFCRLFESLHLLFKEVPSMGAPLFVI